MLEFEILYCFGNLGFQIECRLINFVCENDIKQKFDMELQALGNDFQIERSIFELERDSIGFC